MKIILSLGILFLFFSCSSPEPHKQKTLQNNLIPEFYISELSNKLHEISGLTYYDGLLWGFNDSGGDDVLYGFTSAGKIKREVKIKDSKNRDWEAITQDEDNIYIGDFGNNGGSRDNLCIYKIKKSDIDGGAEQKVDSKKMDFEYAEQNQFVFLNNTTPYDCEAMVAFKGHLYIFSKNWKELTSKVYKIPTSKGDYKVTAIDSFNVDGLITGADISPDKNTLALVGYKNYKSFIWLFTSFTEDEFFKGKSKRFHLEGLDGSQTEGICFYNKETLLVSTERTRLFRQQVFLFDITTFVDGTH